MAENLPENGDDEFEKFINENADTCSNISLIVLTIREKTKFLINSYNTSLGAYLKLNDSDPLRAELKQHITKLMDYSFRCLDQFDFAVMDDDTEEGDDDVSDTGNNLMDPSTHPSAF
jgi:hypothetical protein